MIKKLMYAGGALALLSSLSVGLPLWSYARCGGSWIAESASDAVPLEWELKRARQMIVDLKPEIDGNAKRIAKEKVEVARLHRQLTDTEERLAKSRSNIQRLTDDVQTGQQHFTYAGKTYTLASVKTDLNNRFKRFKTREETANKLRQMVSARESSLQAAHDRMEAMLSARRQLEVEVENLQARLAALRVAQVSSDLSLDNSQLSQTRELLDAISTRINVEEETLNAETEYLGEIQLDEVATTFSVDEIASYMNGDVQGDDEQLTSIVLD
ncbi:MAG: hypothetical protein AAGA03_06980 [Planctomycetota bacterium]